MNSLPLSIERYLIDDAGFSPSELLVLRHLLSGEILTLRMLSAKTGKSIGALDQALKKLLKRGIVCRQKMNGSPKYVLASPESLRDWMKEDMQAKKRILLRREQDFESFLRTIEFDLSRPRIEYFEGEEEMEKAYRKLLDLTDKELFSSMPALQEEEGQNARMALHERFSRERRKRKIFLRVLTCNTPLGRRFQSRDMFEFRETILVPESSYPHAHEKIIAGDTVACFNHGESRMCFVHYPDLAFAEKRQFDAVARTAGGAPPAAPQRDEPERKTGLAALYLRFLSLQKGRHRRAFLLCLCAFFFLFVVPYGYRYVRAFQGITACLCDP